MGENAVSDAATTIGPWTYVWRAAPRPFLHPVRTPAGHVISCDAPDDHWWHHGLWFTIKFVNGENFWEEYDEFGLLEQTEPPEVSRHDDRVEATSRLRWQRPEGRGVVIEQKTTLVHRDLDDRAHCIDWDVALRPVVDVELDRTPFTTWGGYGGLTFRGRADWHDTSLMLPDGRSRERVLGDRAVWLSLQGPVTALGDPEVGLVIMDHPDNPTWPSPWYASTRAETYGSSGWSNFANAAFLWDGPITVSVGNELRLRHRVIVHDGVWTPERISDEWQRWSGGTSTAAPLTN